MAELRTVFEMITTQIEPDVDAWSQLAERHQRAARHRKLAALGLVAVIVAAIALFASVALDRARYGTLPAIPPGSRSAPTFTIVGTDGSIVAAILGFDGTATPDLSPDGTTIAFTIHDWSSSPQIATMQVDGTGFRILTNDPIAAKQPRWSPDGTQLVYLRQDADGILRLMVMDADGSDAHQIEGTNSNMADFNPPDWSPDGSRILFTTFHGGPPLMATIPVSGGRPELIETGSGWPEVGGAWSPDGSSIAYTRGVREEGGLLIFEVWVMNADGSGSHRLAALPVASAEAPAWSPDGSKVAFIGTNSGIYRNGGVLYVIDVASGEITEVLNGTATARRHENRPIWLPDGNTLLVMTQSS
jgi:Tol biopolymer transport system component